MSFISPAKIVSENFNLTPGMKVADFGCGAGHFTLEIARLVGKDGLVYAFDVQEEVLSALKSSVSVKGLANIEICRADLEKPRGTQLADGIADLVLVSNILFQAENKEAVIKEAFRILKSGGRAILIEWLTDAVLGPAKELRLPKDEAAKLFSEVGFSFSRGFDADTSHYGLIFTK
ncbi:class I SAM-dependent methyltransferase [Patescibacteria group bacterium]|nr:class I SAM-dependent methyltransferase [Patescibacteria group bacterium]